MKSQDPHFTDPHVDLDQIFHHTELPQTKLAKRLDRFVEFVGTTFSWCWVLLVAVIVINVVMRYVFGNGRVEFEELQWHLYSAGFLIGLSYCVVHDDHVRVDILHDRFNVRTQAWVELFGILFLLMPFIGTIIFFSIPYVLYSWELNEYSDAPGGLPARYVIKSFLLWGFGLLALSVIARLLRVTALLFGKPTPLLTSGEEI